MTSLRAVFDSPLLAKDTLTRGRSWITAAVVVAELCLLSGFAYAMSALFSDRRPDRYDALATLAFQLAVLAVLAASLAAGAISSERERNTLDLLLLGRLRPLGIVAAKFAAAMSWVVLVAVTALPVLIALFLSAGMGFGPLVATGATTLATAAAVGAAAVLLSARSRHTAAAMVGAYTAAVVLLLGTGLAGLVAGSVGAEGPLVDKPAAAHPLVFANPFYALHASVSPGWGGGSHLGRLGQLLLGRHGRPSSWGPVVQPWQLAVGVQLALCALFLWGAARSVALARAPRRRRGGGRGPVAATA